MINTIFYYPDSLTFEEYQSKVGTDIADRTIVFADAQKAIYKGGKQYGLTDLSGVEEGIRNNSELISQLNTLINGAIEDLNEFKESNGTEVQGMINDAIDKYKSFLDLVQNGDASWGDLFAYGHGFSDAMQSYLQGIGFIDQNGVAKWSEIEQSIGQLSATVGQIQETQNGYSDLESRIKLAVLGDQAITSLTSSWAYTHGSLLEYAFSGFKSQAEEGKSIAQMFADVDTSVASAIAGVKAEATQTYATLNAMTQLQSTVSGMVSSAGLDSAVAALFAQNTNTDSRAAIAAFIDEYGSTITLTADQISAIANQVDVVGTLNVVNNNRIVASIKQDGTADFHDGHIKFTNSVRSIPGTYITPGENTVALSLSDNASKDESLFIEPHAIGFQSTNGGLHSSIWCGHDGNTNSLHLNSYSSGASVGLQINSDGSVYADSNIESRGAIKATDKFSIGNNLGVTTTVKCANGTATFIGGILTNFVVDQNYSGTTEPVTTHSYNISYAWTTQNYMSPSHSTASFTINSKYNTYTDGVLTSSVSTPWSLDQTSADGIDINGNGRISTINKVSGNDGDTVTLTGVDFSVSKLQNYRFYCTQNPNTSWPNYTDVNTEVYATDAEASWDEQNQSNNPN